MQCGGLAGWLERHLAGGGMSTTAFASSSVPREFLHVPHIFIWQAGVSGLVNGFPSCIV